MRDPSRIFEEFQDHPTFCRESLTVLSEQGQLVPMILGPAQVRLNEAVQRQREAGKPVRIVFLKSRRVQVSTATAAQFFHGTPFRSGQHCVVVAHDLDTADNITDIYRRFERYYKPFGDTILLPARKSKSDEEPEWINGSWIKVQTANNLKLGRSFAIRRLHLDEFAFYADARTLMTSVMASVPKDPDSMVVIASTANGIGNEFHRMWLEASDPQGGSAWQAVFFAWWEFPSNSMALEIAPDRFQHSLDSSEREMMRRYNLQLEQLQWRRWIIKNELGGSDAKFRQEHPGNPEEAFIASGRLYFDVASINRMPVQPEATAGGLEEYTYGVEKRITFVPREKGELIVFRRPVEGRSYVAGADVAEGKDANEGEGEADSDFSVLSIFDAHTGEQCAILRCRLQPPEFGSYAYAVLRWYKNAFLCPEANGPGLWMVTEVTNRGYPAALIYHRNHQADEDPATRADLIGWKTTTVTRPILLSTLDRALREASISIHDAVSIRELMTFVIKPNGKPEASKSNHDDTVFANALAVVGMQTMPRVRTLAPQDGYGVQKYGGVGEQPGRRGSLLKLR